MTIINVLCGKLDSGKTTMCECSADRYEKYVDLEFNNKVMSIKWKEFKDMYKALKCAVEWNEFDDEDYYIAMTLFDDNKNKMIDYLAEVILREENDVEIVYGNKTVRMTWEDLRKIYKSMKAD